MRTQATQSVGTTYYFYSPEMKLLAETELKTTAGAPAILYEYVWFNGHPVAQIDGGTTTHWTFTDHLGTPILQMTSTGSVWWRGEYEPYGRIFSTPNGNQHQPLRLPGQEAEQLSPGDTPNGLTERSYNIFRWYRPGWGRYTQSDPIGLQAGTNLYGYVAENPVGWADPLGLFVQLLCRRVTASGLPWWKGALVNASRPLHCRVRVKCNGYDKTVGLENLDNGDIRPTTDDYSASAYGEPWSSSTATCSQCDCVSENCILKNLEAARRRPSLVPRWIPFPGPNSNTYAAGLLNQCGCKGDFPMRAFGSGF
jgi:RHS repeat-associated protein